MVQMCQRFPSLLSSSCLSCMRDPSRPWIGSDAGWQYTANHIWQYAAEVNVRTIKSVLSLRARLPGGESMAALFKAIPSKTSRKWNRLRRAGGSLKILSSSRRWFSHSLSIWANIPQWITAKSLFLAQMFSNWINFLMELEGCNLSQLHFKP